MAAARSRKVDEQQKQFNDFLVAINDEAEADEARFMEEISQLKKKLASVKKKFAAAEV